MLTKKNEYKKTLEGGCMRVTGPVCTLRESCNSWHRGKKNTLYILHVFTRVNENMQQSPQKRFSHSP